MLFVSSWFEDFLLLLQSEKNQTLENEIEHW